MTMTITETTTTVTPATTTTATSTSTSTSTTPTTTTTTYFLGYIQNVRKIDFFLPLNHPRAGSIKLSFITMNPVANCF